MVIYQRVSHGVITTSIHHAVPNTTISVPAVPNPQPSPSMLNRPPTPSTLRPAQVRQNGPPPSTPIRTPVPSPVAIPSSPVVPQSPRTPAAPVPHSPLQQQQQQSAILAPQLVPVPVTAVIRTNGPSPLLAGGQPVRLVLAPAPVNRQPAPTVSSSTIVRPILAAVLRHPGSNNVQFVLNQPTNTILSGPVILQVISNYLFMDGYMAVASLNIP